MSEEPDIRATKHWIHPLRAIFGARRMTVSEGMDWLQDRGLVSDECVWPEDVATSDVARVVALFEARRSTTGGTQDA